MMKHQALLVLACMLFLSTQIVAQNVGIGLDTPTHKLTILSSDTNTVRLLGPDTLGSGARLSFGNLGGPFFEEDEDDRLTIYSKWRTGILGGWVGVGTKSPEGPLHTFWKYGGFTTIVENTDTVGDFSGVYSLFKNDVGTGFSLGLNSTTHFDPEATFLDVPFDLKIIAGGAERMRMTQNGDVGIGTNNPQFRLDVLSDSVFQGAFMQVNNADRTQFARLFSGHVNDPSPFLNWQSGSPFRFVTSDSSFAGFTEHMRIEGNGDVGIGEQDPLARLHMTDGALLVEGVTGGIDSIGAGTRLMWIPEKKAFRAGEVSSTQWDPDSIGDYSAVVGGHNNIASGHRSFIGGGHANATSGGLSFIGGGLANTAIGEYSFVGGGGFNMAIGEYSFIGGGSSHFASGDRSFIGGGSFNTSPGDNSFVGGGEQTGAFGENSFVGGGTGIRAHGENSFIGGGYNNLAEGDRSFVGGGEWLRAISYSETVFGTFNTNYIAQDTFGFNPADRLFVVGNGTAVNNLSNAVTVLKNGKVGIGTDTPDAMLHLEDGALLAQGTTGSTPVSGAGTRLMWIPEKKAFRAGEVFGTQWDNALIGFHSFVGGGVNNTALGIESFVGGGFSNVALGIESFVGGGVNNLASGNNSFVGGGQGMTAVSYAEAVFGTFNTDYVAQDTFGFNAADRLFVIGNGTAQDARSNAVTVLKNGKVGIGTDTPNALLHLKDGALLAQGSTGSIDSIGAGTRLMWIPEKKAFRAGEVSGAQWDNANIGPLSFIGGGFNNTASGLYSFVGGGFNNTASGDASFVGGGFNNTASGEESFVGGGFFNFAKGQHSFVGGGGDNTASGDASFVGGGLRNTASGSRSFVGSGFNNTASGLYSFVGGGNRLTAVSYAEAVFGTYNTDYVAQDTFGFNAADRLFVIGNGTSSIARSNAVTVMKNGNVGIGTDTPLAKLHVSGLDNNGVDEASLKITSGPQTMLLDGNEIEVPGGALFVQNTSSGDVYLANGGGNVGIGTTSPARILHVHGGSTGVTPTSFATGVFENSSHNFLHLLTPDNSSSGMIFGIPLNASDGSIIYNEAPIIRGLRFNTNGDTRMVLDQNGNLGIGFGAVVPSSRLNVKGVTRVEGPGSINVLLTSAGGFDDLGAVVVFDGLDVDQAGIIIDPVTGDGIVYGDVKSFVMPHPDQTDKNIWYASLEGPEAGAYERGTAMLQNGEAFVTFSDHFQIVANPETMTVLLTPTEWDTYGLAVIEKTAIGFKVKELKGGTGNFEFDWEVKCVRKGFENFEVIRDKSAHRFTRNERQ